MALIGTVKFSELMTWGSWIKKDYVRDIPSPNKVNDSYKKIKKQLENMTKTIEKYIIGTVINYGEQGNDNSFYLETNIKFENDMIDQITVTHDKKICISLFGHMYLYAIHEFDIDTQIKIMNTVEKIVSKMEKTNRTNFKF